MRDAEEGHPPQAGAHVRMAEVVNDTLAFVARNLDVSVHQHNAVQLVVSLDRPYDAILGTQTHPGIGGFLIDSNVPHACYAKATSVLVASVDALTQRGSHLKRAVLRGRRYVLLEELMESSRFAAAVERFKNLYEAGQVALFDALLDALGAGTPPREQIDPRIDRVVTLLTEHFREPLSRTQLACEVGLSERRLRQLFREQTGISMQRFILWARIRSALRLMMRGDPLAGVANVSGFADQAHLTRTFKAMFGVPPALFQAKAQFLETFG